LENVSKYFHENICKNEDYVSLSDQLYHLKIRSIDNIDGFNDRFNSFVIVFLNILIPPKMSFSTAMC